MGKLITTLQHPDALVNRIQDGIAQVVNPLLKAWYGKFGIPGDCSASIIEKRVTLADDWIAATLLNSWVNYGAPYSTARYKKKNGIVYVTGLVKNGTIPAAIFDLPAAYYPSGGYVIFSAQSYTTGFITSRLDVSSTVNAASGGNGYFSIECCFPALDPSPVPNSIFPLMFPHGLTPGKVVTTVLLADAIDTVSLAHVSSSCSWEAYGADQVRIIDLPGLFPLRTYDLSFLVLGG
jgi:hypothetical protein